MTKKAFSDAINDSLNKSSEQLSPEVRDQLRQARENALAKPQTNPNARRWQVATSAIAASILLAVVLPNIVQTPAPEEPLDTLTYLDVDPEMLEVMDLLIEFGELADNDAI